MVRGFSKKKKKKPFKFKKKRLFIVFTIIFCIPLEHNSDVMEDTTRVLLMVCVLSLSTQVIFKVVTNKKKVLWYNRCYQFAYILYVFDYFILLTHCSLISIFLYMCNKVLIKKGTFNNSFISNASISQKMFFFKL